MISRILSALLAPTVSEELAAIRDQIGDLDSARAELEGVRLALGRHYTEGRTLPRSVAILVERDRANAEIAEEARAKLGVYGLGGTIAGIERMRADAKAAEAEVDRLNAKVAEIKGALSPWRKDVAHLVDAVRDLVQERQNYAKAVNVLDGMIRARGAEIDDLSAQLEDREEDRLTLADIREKLATYIRENSLAGQKLGVVFDHVLADATSVAADERALTRLMAVHGYTPEPGAGWKRFGRPVVATQTAVGVIEAEAPTVAHALGSDRGGISGADLDKMSAALFGAGIKGGPGAWRWHSDPQGTTFGTVAAFCRLMLERLDIGDAPEEAKAPALSTSLADAERADVLAMLDGQVRYARERGFSLAEMVYAHVRTRIENGELLRENEVLRSNSDHLSSENASLARQVESMAMRIESLAEELAKPEDVRLREVLDALDGRAVIFDGLGVRVTHLLDEMDEWIARAGAAERRLKKAEEVVMLARQLTAYSWEDRLEDCEVSDAAKHDSRELSTAIWFYDQEEKS